MTEVTMQMVIDGETLTFTLPPEAFAGKEPDVEAILCAMIEQMPNYTDADRAKAIRKWITEWVGEE
ncbi:hypothetical protein [Sphingomonas xinjiangensis]|uniref:Uncharacterized protein n=1 Tax=Sphingomonas xinjiangensis TaxID=643568 RepID=A0A840YFS8_9SPHN|nr:hypothetical protein [Sphingomonas xinjiangensis]MBB5710829.1 hypothetical protein [Sphingomonas xinjiangensis]